MMYKRYEGVFSSRGGVLWRVEILQENDTAYSPVGELEFPAEEPLTIEWEETDKEVPVTPSSATLTILSPGDRTYEDLYTIEVGKIRMDVYRNGALYWSGTLDPEFYEEPYTTGSDYEVSLTFSDFGILDRLKYDLSGMQGCHGLLERILEKSGISYSGIEDILTTIPDGESLASGSSALSLFSVRSDNFYDEDGEASTLREVLDGILQPLGAKMQQRGGKIWLYELHSAFEQWGNEKIRWAGDDQTMGVDKVINNAKIKLSTYSDAELLDGKMEYPGEYGEETTNITNDDKGCYSFYTDYSADNRIDGSWDYSLMSFTIFLQGYDTPGKDTGLADVGTSMGARYFHIQPLLGGQEDDGVLAFMYTQGHGNLKSGWCRRVGINPSTKRDATLMKTRRVYVPALSSEEAARYYVRLTVEMLVDARYNPFTDANDGNESGNYNDLKVWFGYVMVPAAVNLYDESGNAVAHYDNSVIARSTDKLGHLAFTKGEWKSGEGGFGSCWLEWYDPDDRAENSGVLGWKKNRHNIGLSKKSIYKSFSQMDEGQYIPYPPQGGYLEVTVYVGLYPYDYGETDFDTQERAEKKDLYNKIRWWLFKAPSLEVVKANIVKSDAETDDIEYNSYLNEAAKDDLEIDTVCGTAEKPCPTSRANFLSATSGAQVKTVKRAGRTSQAEKLLLGTLYSQYAGRRTKLTGTATLGSTGMALYTDAMQGEKKFLCVGEVQDLQADESEMTLTELRPDEYDESMIK